MLEVPVIREQNAYNCGTYSLWMALESIQREADDELIRKIEHGARIYSDSMGGLFNYVHMERIIIFLGFQCRKVRFHDIDTFCRYLNRYQECAMIVAYSYYLLFPSVSGGEVGDLAHWSVITALREEEQLVEIANPHGERQNFPINLLVNANLALRQGTFNWKKFIDKSEGDLLYEQERKKYKNETSELKKRGRQRINLGGYLLAISSVN
jgi:hypothetical protein